MAAIQRPQCLSLGGDQTTSARSLLDWAGNDGGLSADPHLLLCRGIGRKPQKIQAVVSKNSDRWQG